MRKLTRMTSRRRVDGRRRRTRGGHGHRRVGRADDPPKGVTPRPYDIVGVGFDHHRVRDGRVGGRLQHDDPNAKHSPSNPGVYSWDALPPGTDPNGGHQDRAQGGLHGDHPAERLGHGPDRAEHHTAIHYKGAIYPCLNFDRSSGARKPTNPKKAPGGVVFVAFAKDAITWATRSPAKGGSDAPKSLSLNHDAAPGHLHLLPQELERRSAARTPRSRSTCRSPARGRCLRGRSSWASRVPWAAA